ncbi:hypothetical protein NMY3_00113 [Candidatus Nitrosocosmicus oleophilus]|uniref:Uncharacterized protein n=1 Tax=Candidatus Nitrosocosmicus oleophilus TaxID=1353260 RepID=A0A654LTH8_9ARCH|nr:hypothetical protein NMY3_00113 [Candidatus Nitrosocosmicus oleophilus]
MPLLFQISLSTILQFSGVVKYGLCKYEYNDTLFRNYHTCNTDIILVLFALNSANLQPYLNNFGNTMRT